MSKLKTDDNLKLQLIGLVNSGYSVARAARELGIKERTAQCFYNKEVAWAVDWWKRYNYSKNLQTFEDVDVSKTFLGSGNPPTLKKVVDHVEKLEMALGVKDVPVKVDKPLKILVIADTQCKPSEDLSYMSWIGKYINDKKPDVVVHIGDHFDFESLSSYDKGKKSFEGRRLKADIKAGNDGLRLLTREFLFDDYHPRMVFCMGNHEARFDRLSEDMPELDGFVGTETLNLESLGWEVHPFLKPVEIEGIYFVHYLANPFSGKPYGGNALNQLKTVGRSFVVGHKQCLDVAVRPTIDGKHQIGIINGAAYPFEERYKGYQGNNHFRGITMLHEVKDGFGLPMFISLDYLKSRYN